MALAVASAGATTLGSCGVRSCGDHAPQCFCDRARTVQSKRPSASYAITGAATMRNTIRRFRSARPPKRRCKGAGPVTGNDRTLQLSSNQRQSEPEKRRFQAHRLRVPVGASAFNRSIEFLNARCRAAQSAALCATPDVRVPTLQSMPAAHVGIALYSDRTRARGVAANCSNRSGRHCPGRQSKYRAAAGSYFTCQWEFRGVRLANGERRGAPDRVNVPRGEQNGWLLPDAARLARPRGLRKREIQHARCDVLADRERRISHGGHGLAEPARTEANPNALMRRLGRQCSESEAATWLQAETWSAT